MAVEQANTYTTGAIINGGSIKYSACFFSCSVKYVTMILTPSSCLSNKSVCFFSFSNVCLILSSISNDLRIELIILPVPT